MVTKLDSLYGIGFSSSVLAKILMVTKHLLQESFIPPCSVLAKILMVTKLGRLTKDVQERSVLAKILMVTKL